MVKFILIKSPDEWATTKQACRAELVVYLFFSPIYSSLYFYILSTVLQTSSFYTCTFLSPFSTPDSGFSFADSDFGFQFPVSRFPVLGLPSIFFRKVQAWETHFLMQPRQKERAKPTYMQFSFCSKFREMNLEQSFKIILWTEKTIHQVNRVWMLLTGSKWNK